MVNETQNFSDRLDRIQGTRRRNKGGMGFVVHPDGVVTAIGRPSSRLRFAFPLKGLILGLMIVSAVKAYVMWFLGTDVYALEVESLLSGTSFEQVAALVLMPDPLTSWLVVQYEAIFVFVQAGLAANATA